MKSRWIQAVGTLLLTVSFAGCISNSIVVADAGSPGAQPENAEVAVSAEGTATVVAHLSGTASTGRTSWMRVDLPQSFEEGTFKLEWSGVAPRGVLFETHYALWRIHAFEVTSSPFVVELVQDDPRILGASTVVLRAPEDSVAIDVEWRADIFLQVLED